MSCCAWSSSSLLEFKSHFNSFSCKTRRPFQCAPRASKIATEKKTSSDLPHLILHDALEAAGIDTCHARDAREGFCSQISRITELNGESSIAISRGADLAKVALQIAAEDDSLVSHSSVPLPVSSFISRLDDLSFGFCSNYLPPSGSSPEIFFGNLERYLYVDKGFRRIDSELDARSLYLHSTLTCRSGSPTMLSLIYSEVLKMVRVTGFLDFDAEIYCPDSLEKSLPRGYDKKKSKISDETHIITARSLIVKILKNLKDAFWPFQYGQSSSLFLRAVHAANRVYGSSVSQDPTTTNENVSPMEIASAKAAQHRLQRGVWTSVRFGDMRRALAACERLILLHGDNEEVRDYAALLYHCGYYEDCLKHLTLFEASQEREDKTNPINKLEDDAVNILKARVNLIMAEEGWNKPSATTSYWSSNYEPW
ncbi:transglutaminase family protein [Rhynchospora pubera]|uniref:Transglutaminase family protein n=1 Tax=Rhynchospora pubera TaxID=906938 RepID=A0AAV8FU93_9POAL|nr:transglutaminase family protein [Rhynchospora pubera]KAJ4795120.1 transglutaminase family protein [Rhynchospora pubera]